MDDSAELESRLALLNPSVLVVAAAGTTCAAGLFTAGSGLQILDLIFYDPWLRPTPHAMIVIGVLSLVFALQLYRLRTWAAFAAAVGDVVIAIGMTAWLIFSLANGVVSLIALLAPPTAAAGAILALLSIGNCRRATRARRELSDSGIELGL